MSYRPFDFSEALRHLRDGAAVTRKGWNGKNMFLFWVPGSRIVVSKGRPLAQFLPVDSVVNYQDHIDMKTAQGTVVPWLCSQSDMLATDWDFLHVEPFFYTHWRDAASESHSTRGEFVFRFTPQAYFKKHHCLADSWEDEAMRYLSCRWERIMDNTYVYRGHNLERAKDELEALGWTCPEEFDSFVNRA